MAGHPEWPHSWSLNLAQGWEDGSLQALRQFKRWAGTFWTLFLQSEDPIVEHLGSSTEEGKKVLRNGGKNFPAVFRRIQDPLLQAVTPNPTLP